MRHVLALSVAVLQLFILSAPARAADTEVTLYHYQNGERAKALRAILDDFQKANAGIVVKDVYKQSTQITSEIQAALAAKRPIDLAQVLNKNTVYFAKNTPAVSIEEASRGDTRWLNAYQPNFLDAGKVNGKVYALPHVLGTALLYVNKDIFRKAGLNPDLPLKTWDQVIAAARVIKSKTGMAGVAQYHADMGDLGTALMVTNAGATYLNPEGTEARFDSPEGIAALQMWQDMAKSGIMPVANDQQWYAAFSGGRMAMYITSSAFITSLTKAAAGKFDLGIQQYPQWKTTPRRIPPSGGMLMLFAPAGERRDASMKLLRYLAKPEISNRWSRETGYMPLARNPAADPAMAKYIAEFPAAQQVIDQMGATVASAQWPEQGALEAQTHIKNMLDELWAGKRPASQIVPETVRKVNQALGAKRAEAK